MNIDRSWLKNHRYFKGKAKKPLVNKLIAGNPASDVDKEAAERLAGAKIRSYVLYTREVRFKDINTDCGYRIPLEKWNQTKDDIIKSRSK